MQSLDFSSMTPAVSATLAQVIPVLMLTLLFETKLRPARERELSTLGVIFGFLGNLALALGALITEFALLLSLNVNGAAKGAEPLWVASASLFAVVVLRWAATSLATRVAFRPVSTELARGLHEALNEVLNVTADAIVHGLVSPAQVLADMVETSARALLVVAVALSNTLRDVARAVVAGMHVVWMVMTDVARTISQVFRR